MAVPRRKSMALILMACALALGACSKDYKEFEETHTLKLSLTVLPYAQQSVMSKDEADPVDWTVHCVSLDTEGVKTANTAIYDGEADMYEITDIPDDTDTLCQLVDSEDRLIATISVSDYGALGGARDIFRLKESTEATIAYNSALEAAMAHGTGFEFSDAEERVDLQGKWGMGCRDVRDVVTDEVDEGMSCSEEVDAREIFMHRVNAHGSLGELRIAYGIWRSDGAYLACGSTEGLDALPSTWRIHNESEDAVEPFAWSAPFEGVSGSTSSEDIIAMIRANDTEGMSTYEEFKDANDIFCENEDECTTQYYYEMRAHGIANADSICWPLIAFTYDAGVGAKASLWPSAGGSAKPLGHLHFIEAFEYGNETYMRSSISQVRKVYGVMGVVECKMKEEFLMSVEIPDSDEDDAEIEGVIRGADDDLISPGTRLEAKYHSSTEVASVKGYHDNICEQELGEDDRDSASGFYSDVVLESITAE